MATMYRRMAITAAAVLAALTMSAGCNTHTAVLQVTRGSIQGKLDVAASDTTTMDILWVIDNSGSMCQEQDILAREFDAFIDTLSDTTLDFHLAVTTTHAPDLEQVNYSFEPIAIEGQLQSAPQPLPGPDNSCLGTLQEGVFIDFAAFRATLETAVSCMATPDMSLLSVTDSQIACANFKLGENCIGQVGGTDRNADGLYTATDLLPPAGTYRELPKVLRSEDYRMANGVLDVERLQADFACLSLVGTRGYGIEKGLQAAVKAVSPELTGGAVDAAGAPALANGDAMAPNHGFIRQDAGFTLIFVTDENDCSHDGSLNESDQCGTELCEYENSMMQSSEDSALVPVEELAAQLRENLEAIKGLERELNDDELVVASIHGQSERFAEPVPTLQECIDGTAPKLVDLVVCQTSLGSATSGDRYERFIRQFTNFFPQRRVRNYAEEQGITFAEAAALVDEVTEDSAICQGTFRPALQAISEFLAGIDSGCVTDIILPCEADAECPTHFESDDPGRCLSTVSGRQYCDSGALLRVQRLPGTSALNEIDAMPLCQPGTIDALRAANPSCVVARDQYEWITCASNDNGITFQWLGDDTEIAQQLAGYKLELIYNATVQ